MIKVENLSYWFPQKDLYNKISFTIEENQHCAFIGVSGSGKSTLAELIMDPEKYMFDGKIEIEPSCRIGYVSQFSQLDRNDNLTVFQYMAEKSISLQNEINNICTEMETSTDIEPLLEKYQIALDAYDAIGGDDFENQINKKLNLSDLMKHRDLKLSQLSGGEFKLIQIIKEMLNTPDLMIMDEPDVFLDFENLNSLKNLINSYKGTLLVITHNRYLLNHCFNKILHLENMELQEFDGNYINYNFSLLQTKIELQELAHYDTEEFERNEILIEKLREAAAINSDAAIGKYVNARVKIQERLQARRIKEPFIYINQPNITLSTDKVEENTIALTVNNLNLSFEETLLENVSFEINSTDKVVIIGPNGSGKTTLLREIYKNNNEAIKFNENIEVGYLSQLQKEVLNDSKTISDEFFDSGFKSYDEISNCLVNYGFDKDIIHEKVGSLSSGEKNILQLARLSKSNANMLILDEPTSHLDTYSQVALENAIKNYNGALLMVSHDFYSVVNSMDYVLIIEDKKLRKMSLRKFRKMIYDTHFDKDYLALEQKKQELELKIESALRQNNFESAKLICEELEEVIKQF